ncbi:jg3324 [Pararge aegeria aegeria]|uniref:Jg3324 protein n=1 Tax=Pararge aegeria aegeria TaxID=348720 RepID=A0A8S4RV09_9NEOP|nr:jg3324 [Pararge aegeria aegeria]
MGGAHRSENGWILRSQGAGLAAPHWYAQYWSTPRKWTDDIKRVASLDTSGTKPCNLELPSKELCPAGDVYRLIL